MRIAQCCLDSTASGRSTVMTMMLSACCCRCGACQLVLLCSLKRFTTHTRITRRLATTALCPATLPPTSADSSQLPPPLMVRNFLFPNQKSVFSWKAVSKAVLVHVSETVLHERAVLHSICSARLLVCTGCNAQGGIEVPQLIQ